MPTLSRFTRIHFALCGFVILGVAGCSDSLQPGNEGSPKIVVPSNAFAKSSLASVYVYYRPPAPSDWKSVVADAGISFARQTSLPNVIAGQIDSGSVGKLQSLASDAWIDSVVVVGTTTFPQADVVPWGVDSSGAREVQNLQGFTGTGVKVAVIDNGIDCTHPDLVDRYRGGAAFVSDVTPCTPGDDGTKAAGVIAASVNGSGVIGMAPQVELYSLNVCNPTQGCPSDAIAAAVAWAADSGIQVVSISVGDCGAPYIQSDSADIQAAYDAGVVLVGAAGDGDSSANGFCSDTSGVAYPAAYPAVIAVSAVNQAGQYATGYQYGPQIELAAPHGVLSDRPGGGTDSFSGTSAAAPHVAGAAALVISAYNASGLTPTAATVRQRLTSEAFDALPRGRDIHYGYGILRADRAAVFEPSITAIDGATTVQPGTYTYSASYRWGQPTVEIKWRIQFGTVDSTTSYSASTDLTYTWPTGNYDATLTATPKDAWGRVGSPGTITVVVCTPTQSAPLAASPQAIGAGSPRPVSPYRQWGCSPPPP